MSNILKYQNPSSPLLTSDNSVTDNNYHEKVREMYRLRTEAGSLGTNYTKADSLGEDIAAYTLNKYKDYRGSAIHYGEWAGTSKPYEDEDINFLFDNNIRLEDNGIVDFLKSYTSSEGFNRIRNNQLNWWRTRHPRKKYLYPGEWYDKKQIKYYKDNISRAEKTINYVLDGYPELSFAIPDNRVTYTFKPRYGEDTKRPFDYTQMHEFAHLFNYPVSVSNTINAEVLDQNTNTKKNNHDEYRNEKHSDNLGVKYLLFKEGIYDARSNKDITPEQVQQLRDKYPNLRFLQQLNNEEAAFQINHVVQNTTDPNRIDYKDPVTFAKKGGRIHIKKKNRGKFTDYCGGKVTEECIAKGKNSKDPKIRKRATFAANARKWKHENGGILKVQEGTGNGFWSKLWNAVKEGGMAARDAKLGAVGAQQVRDLYVEGKNQEAQDLAKQYAKANTTGIALAGGAASTGLLGDLMVTGATTAADTFIDGDTENFGKNLSLNAAFDLVGHGTGKLLRNVDWGKVRNSVELIPDNTKADISEYINTIDDALPERQPLTIRKSSQFWDGTSKSKLSVDEKMGLPKSERNQPIKSNPNAGAVTNVDTYVINRAYAPWEIRNGKFIFKMGEPINVRGLSERAPITFHFTTDTQVKPHSGGDSWANAKTTYLVPYKSVVKHNGMPANIEPMDTWWTAGSTFEFPTQDVKVLTADPKVYRQYKVRGIDVEFSPEGRKLVREGKGMSDIVEQWIRNKQDQFGMRPTVDTYRQMERETGLPSGVRPKKKHLFGDYFEETNIPDYHTGPATHSNSWSFPAMANIGLPNDPKYFMSSIARNVALDLSKYKTFTFKDLPALQKLAQTHKQFDIQLPTTYGVKNNYSWDFSGQEELVDKINKILRGEIVVPYEQGGKL